IRILLLRAQFVVDNRPLAPECLEGHIEVFPGIEVAHDDPVCDPRRRHVAAVAQERHEVRRAVEPGVFDQIPEGDRIELACVHRFRAASNRDREREVADPREEVHDDRARTDAVRDADSFREVPGREHHARDVERVSNASLDMHGFGPASPQHANVGCAQRSMNARDVLNDRPDAEDRAEDLRDRPRFPRLTQRKSEDEDVANSLPPPRRAFDRDARRTQSFADFLTWVALRDADRKRWAGLYFRAKGAEVKSGGRADRDQDRISLLHGLHSSVDETLAQQLPEQRLRIFLWHLDRGQRSDEWLIRFHSILRYTSRYIYEERPASARIMRAPALALALLVLAVVLTPPTTAEDGGAGVELDRLPGGSGEFPTDELHRGHGRRQSRHAARIDFLPVELLRPVLGRLHGERERDADAVPDGLPRIFHGRAVESGDQCERHESVHAAGMPRECEPDRPRRGRPAARLGLRGERADPPLAILPAHRSGGALPGPRIPLL